MRQLFSTDKEKTYYSIFSRLNNNENNEKPINHRVGKIDLMWSLFYLWPGKAPRLQQIESAAQRIDIRRNIRPTLPARDEFLTTASYYENIMPLVLARSRFITMLKPSSFLRGVHMALSRIALKTPDMPKSSHSDSSNY